MSASHSEVGAGGGEENNSAFSSPASRGRWRDADTQRDGGGVRLRPYSHPFFLKRTYSTPQIAAMAIITAG